MNPPDEKFPQSLTARGNVTRPKRKRQKLHQRQREVSAPFIVNTPNTVTMAKGINKSKYLKGEVDPNRESSKSLLMTRLLQMN